MGQICPCCNRHKNNHLKILTDIKNINSVTIYTPPNNSPPNYSAPNYSPPNYSPPNYSPPIYSLPKKNNIIQIKLLDNAVF